jgi:hypothetical protein
MINIDHYTLQTTLERIKSRADALEDRNIFDSILDDVVKLIELDMLPKFLRQRESLEGPLTGSLAIRLFFPKRHRPRRWQDSSFRFHSFPYDLNPCLMLYGATGI